MSAYTPGPWHALSKLPASYSDHGYRRVASMDGRTGGPVIYAEAKNMLQEGRGFVWGDVSADARLIAAAPDLLAVLLEAVEAPMRTEGSDWWVRVNAAIAKATGAQQ